MDGSHWADSPQTHLDGWHLVQPMCVFSLRTPEHGCPHKHIRLHAFLSDSTQSGDSQIRRMGRGFLWGSTGSAQNRQNNWTTGADWGIEKALWSSRSEEIGFLSTWRLVKFCHVVTGRGLKAGICCWGGGIGFSLSNPRGWVFHLRVR
jgi:hypothetical protein